MESYLLQTSKTQITHAKQQSQLYWELTSILVPNREEKVVLFEEQELCEYDGIRLRLTDQWMDLYNSIITELMV
jgi:hypothetical protein